MNHLVKLHETQYSRRLIRSMRDEEMWSVKDHGDDHYSLHRKFADGSRSITYCPTRIKYELNGNLFGFSLSDAPDLSLSFVEGVLAYFAFRARVRAFKRQKAFNRQQRTINFLKESGV